MALAPNCWPLVSILARIASALSSQTHQLFNTSLSLANFPLAALDSQLFTYSGSISSNPMAFLSLPSPCGHPRFSFLLSAGRLLNSTRTNGPH
ncbi:hypothetical protein BC567DRAFT_41690 [Phyllosticta citribraziliensis]